MDELLSEFIVESNEGLAQLDNDLIELEKDPNNTDLLSGIFRTMHTIKGTCGFIGLDRLGKVAHSSENVLGRIRDNEIPVSGHAISLILESVDRVKDILGELEEKGSEPEGDDSDLISKLEAVAAGEAAPAEEAPAEPESEAEIEAEAEPEEAEVQEEEKPKAAKKTARKKAPAKAKTKAKPKKKEEEVKAEEPKVEKAPEKKEEKKEAVKAEEPKDENKPVAKNPAATIASQTIRVNLNVLENLMTMVSELVLTRNQLLQISNERENDELVLPLQRLNYVTSELQEGVMKTRMQPISGAWNKLPRIIRDLENDLGKKIHLEMLGGDTELDRQVLEMIRDPITHMVRNSADHGIESIEDRIIQGKKEQGTITLDAFHAGGHIIIEIKDDGAGLNTDRIRKKILENELATEAEVESMSDAQIHDHIFHAGFSTAEVVTSVSGRGVGMDVVRTNIEKIGGNVAVKSVGGKGSVFTIQIPLTLAIVSALVVESGGEKFAMPQISVLEIVRDSKTSEHRVENINGSPVLRLRNKLLPLISLEKHLGIEKKASKTPEAEANIEAPQEDSKKETKSPKKKAKEVNEFRNKYIIVTEVGSLKFGLIVDQVFDTQEIVVKPVSPMLKKINTFSGNTILGDGSVIMILDPNGIASSLSNVSQDDADAAAHEEKKRLSNEKKTSFMVFKADGDEPKAVPLGFVARLEDIKMEDVEKSGKLHVVQYRDKLMPLTSIDGKLHKEKEGQKPVLVFSDAGRYVGLVVDEIVDIMEEQFDLKMKSSNEETYGSAVFGDKTTDIVNVDYYLRNIYKDWQIKSLVESNDNRQKEALYIEPNSFFMNLISPILKNEDLFVRELTKLDEGMELIEEGERYDLVLVDLDQDIEKSIEIAELVASKSPDSYVIALTSQDLQDEVTNDLFEAGFSEVISKLDRNLIAEVVAKETTAAKSEAA